VALDDRHANKFAPVNSKAIYPKHGHKLLYTPMTSEMKYPISYYTFALCILFYLLFCWCNTCTNQSQMIWSTLYHHMTILVHLSRPHLFFIVASVHWWSLVQASPSHTVSHFKAFNLPFTLAIGLSSQSSSWSSPPWPHNSMLCMICNELLHHHMCEPCNISPSWHILLTHMYL